jgi:hypothetical protein
MIIEVLLIDRWLSDIVSQLDDTSLDGNDQTE